MNVKALNDHVKEDEYLRNIDDCYQDCKFTLCQDLFITSLYNTCLLNGKKKKKKKIHARKNFFLKKKGNQFEILITII